MGARIRTRAEGYAGFRVASLWYSQPSGPVAQRLEQGTHNPLVRGSNPCGPTKASRFVLNELPWLSQSEIPSRVVHCSKTVVGEAEKSRSKKAERRE